MADLDLDAISSKWLQICGACDAGTGECTHPAEDYRPVMLELVREIERLRDDRDRVWTWLSNARAATRRLTAYLIGNASRLDVPFSNFSGSPWSLHVSPAVNRLREALGMRGVAANCCDMHSRTCEPPSELCCEKCSEATHPAHVDGSFCSAPDLSGVRWPAPPVEDALRDEVERLRAAAAYRKAGA
jgi:hypothetical protein